MSSSLHYLSVDDVLTLHRLQIEHFGGQDGVRDRGLIESAVAMPMASFGGADLHPDLFDKASAYLFHLAQNHPFIWRKTIHSSTATNVSPRQRELCS